MRNKADATNEETSFSDLLRYRRRFTVHCQIQKVIYIHILIRSACCRISCKVILATMTKITHIHFQIYFFGLLRFAKEIWSIYIEFIIRPLTKAHTSLLEA